MIAGTIALEGHALHFALGQSPDGSHHVNLTVQEGFEGLQSTYRCSAAAFAAALAATIHPDGAIPGDGLDFPSGIRDRVWALIEGAAPPAPEGWEGDPAPALQSLRWFP